MKKIFIFIIISILLSGCTGVLDSNNTDDNNPILVGNTTEQKPLSCIVYYMLTDNDYLVGQQHFISVPETKRVEEIIIQQLITGPKTSSLYLQPIINPSTRIVSISENSGLLFLTLSSSFLEPMSGTPANWQNDEAWTDIVMTQRRLALHALVNTITETGKYSKLQLFIDYDDSGQGERPTRGEIGLLDDNSSQFLEPIGRNSSVIFTPEIAIYQFLSKFSEKNWEDAASYIDIQNQDSDLENIALEFSQLDLTLVDYRVKTSTISPDGQSAIVTIDYFIKSKDGVEYTNSNVSLLVNLTDEIWQLSYVSMSQLLEVSNG